MLFIHENTLKITHKKKEVRGQNMERGKKKRSGDFFSHITRALEHTLNGISLKIDLMRSYNSKS